MAANWFAVALAICRSQPAMISMRSASSSTSAGSIPASTTARSAPGAIDASRSASVNATSLPPVFPMTRNYLRLLTILSAGKGFVDNNFELDSAVGTDAHCGGANGPGGADGAGAGAGGG